MASKAHVFGSGHLRHLAGVSPATPPSCAAQPLMNFPYMVKKHP
eukprot:COSAG02_NODE_403_length_23058_cov_12.124134_13_plen_44_part_00